MASDAKIDKLVASIDSLVAAMAKETQGTGGSEREQDTARQKEKEKLELQNNRLRLLDRETQKIKEQKEIEDEKLKSLNQQREVIIENVKNDQMSVEDAARELEVLEEQYDIRQKQVAAQERMKDSTLTMLAATFGIQRGLADSVIEAGGLGAKMKSLGSAAKEIFSSKGVLNLGLNIMRSFAVNTARAVVQFDSAVASLNAMSGAAGDLNGLVSQVQINSSALGVGFSEAGQATSALISTVTNFRDLSTDTQVRVTSFAAEMERLGVAANTTGEIFDTLTDGLGLFPEEAVVVQEELAKTAIALAIPPQQMAEGFAQALPYLASFGKDAPEIFAKTAAAAKKLSVEASTLIGITEQFDTFEGAAQSAGQLNALLGGDLLNSFELLNATTDERIRLVLQAVDASGKEFESMSRFEKMAFANAAGIQDMSEASKIFKGGLSAFDDAANALENVAVSQEDLEEAQRASLSLTESLGALMDAFTVAVQPIAEALQAVVKAMLNFNKEYPRATTAILGLVGAFTVFVGILLTMKTVATAASVVGAITSLGTAAAGAAPAVTAAGTGMSAAITQVGAASTAAAPGLLSLGGAIALIGLGIGIAAAGLALFVYSFSFLTGEQLIAAAVGLTAFGVAMGLLIAALVGLGPVSAVAIGVLTAIGVAVAAIGIGIGAAAAGMSVLVGSINDISIAKISSLSKEIRGIGSSLKSIPETKAVAFSQVVEGMVKYSNQVDAAPENLENVEKMVQLAAQYQETQSELKVPSLDSFVEALKGLAGANRAPAAAGAGGGTEIVLKLNDREFGRAVANTLNKDLDMRVR